MWQNLLFDLDGTLTNSAEGITKCVQYGLHSLGLEEENLQKLEVFIGPPLRASYMKYYGLTREEAEAAVAAYRVRFEKVGWKENMAYPGIEELLQALHQQHYRLGICTGKPEYFAVPIARRFGLQPYLETITGSTLDGKMDDKAQVVQLALKRWQLTSPEAKARTLLIGDRREDVLAAHANGIACLGVGYGFGSQAELEEVGAEGYVATVDQLRSYLLQQ